MYILKNKLIERIEYIRTSSHTILWEILNNSLSRSLIDWTNCLTTNKRIWLVKGVPVISLLLASSWQHIKLNASAVELYTSQTKYIFAILCNVPEYIFYNFMRRCRIYRLATTYVHKKFNLEYLWVPDQFRFICILQCLVNGNERPQFCVEDKCKSPLEKCAP